MHCMHIIFGIKMFYYVFLANFKLYLIGVMSRFGCNKLCYYD